MKAAFVNQFRQQLGTEVEVVRHKFNISGLGGSGGGTSGRAMAFCLGRPGSYPGSDFGFFQFSENYKL